jgi:hypothetical protein
MSLDGLRAWIGEVERKLGMRTRVMLVLVALAIGGAGAAVYIAVDAANKSVSEGDLQSVEERLQGEIDALREVPASAEDPRVGALELQVKALQAQVKSLQGEGAQIPSVGSGGSTGDTGANAGGTGGGEGSSTKAK